MSYLENFPTIRNSIFLGHVTDTEKVKYGSNLHISDRRLYEGEQIDWSMESMLIALENFDTHPINEPFYIKINKQLYKVWDIIDSSKKDEQWIALLITKADEYEAKLANKLLKQ